MNSSVEYTEIIAELKNRPIEILRELHLSGNSKNSLLPCSCS